MTRKILIVEDSEIYRGSMEKALKLSGYEIVMASDGEEAFAVALKNKDIELIICDYNMPKTNGMNFCKNLRKLKGFERTPFLMLTTEADEDLKQLGRLHGILAWLVKPISLKQLPNIIEKAIAKASMQLI